MVWHVLAVQHSLSGRTDVEEDAIGELALKEGAVIGINDRWATSLLVFLVIFHDLDA